MPSRSQRKKTLPTALEWAKNTELLGLTLTLTPESNATLLPQYATGLHAWFLNQVRSYNPSLSAYLHDGESEKPFTISGLEGKIEPVGRQLQLFAHSSYTWTVTALCAEVVEWMADWVKNLPPTLELRQCPLTIHSVQIAHSPTTYTQLLQTPSSGSLSLSFLTPTSFRRKGHHFPLPLPTNVFHSYVRRWNDFSSQAVNAEDFLDWIDESVIINRHNLESLKVAAGKRGSVTGFIGAIEYSLNQKADDSEEFAKLFYALGQLSPYCGTGHKTTFGLGQTRLGWHCSPPQIETLSAQTLLAQRIEQLTSQLMQTQKRQGGQRALTVCQTRATILAKYELGASLIEIADELEMPYETVKTYAKLARKAIKKIS